VFRFEHPFLLLLILLAPLLVALYWRARKQRAQAWQRFGNSQMAERMLEDFSERQAMAKLWLYCAAIVLIALAAANPQIAGERETVTRRGADLFIALDISRSMRAEDLAPSRLDRAKAFAQKLVDELRGERIGLIVFAGNAYIQTPLTTDYNALKNFIQNADPEIAPTQGTAIGAAVELAMRAFNVQDDKNRGIVVITDGEDHEDNALDMVRDAVDKGAVVFTIGAGTERGAPIPTGDQNGAYIRDENGEVVQSKLNVPMLEKIASTGNGAYFDIQDAGAASKGIRKGIDELDKQSFEQRGISGYESYFIIPLLPGFILLLIATVLPARRTAWLSAKKLFG
jgi:Ca-activated chloride channel family protein